MGRKKREEVELKPFCYYCDKEFKNENNRLKSGVSLCCLFVYKSKWYISIATGNILLFIIKEKIFCLKILYLLFFFHYTPYSSKKYG